MVSPLEEEEEEEEATTVFDKDAARLFPIPRTVEFPRKDSIGLFALTPLPSRELEDLSLAAAV